MNGIGGNLGWPYGRYHPLHADIFMFNVISIVPDGDITEEENVVVNLRTNALLNRPDISQVQIDDAFDKVGLWFNNVLSNEGKKGAIQIFHTIGAEMAEINNNNPNVLNLKMQLFRDCCAADGEISELEKEILDELADVWNIDKDWTKRLPRYRSHSDYKEEDIEGTYGDESFEFLKDYFTVCFAIGAYSFAEAFEGAGIKNTHIALKKGNNYMFSDHSRALKPIPSNCKGLLCVDREWFVCDNCIKKEKELKCPNGHELKNHVPGEEGYGCDVCGRGIRAFLPEEIEIFHVFDEKSNDFVYVSKICSTAIKNWKRMTMKEGMMEQDMTTSIFLESVINLLTCINIATTTPDNPSDKEVINRLYKILVECAEHNKGDENGLYKFVIAKLEYIKKKWGVTEEVEFSTPVKNPRKSLKFIEDLK